MNLVGSPPAGFASVTRRGGAKRSTRRAKPGGLTEAKGAVRLKALRTGDPLTWPRVTGPCARGGKLPPYGRKSLTLYRGQAVRFILHGAGRASHGGNHETTATG